MKKIGVVLSGCGVYDGSEIHEAVLTLLAIDRNGAEAVCMAPSMEFREVNHLTSQETGATRNALVEAARIARGKIRDVKDVSAVELDAVIFPGGYGAAKNLCTFAEKGAAATINPEVARLIREMAVAKKTHRSHLHRPGPYRRHPRPRLQAEGDHWHRRRHRRRHYGNRQRTCFLPGCRVRR